MTTSDVTSESVPQAACAEELDYRPPSRAPLIISLVVLVLLGAGVLGYQWLTGLTVFAPYGNGVGNQMVLGQTMYTGGIYADTVSTSHIVIDSIEPVLAPGSIPVRSTLMVCRFGGIGMRDGNQIHSLCRRLTTAIGVPWQVDSRDGTLTTGITPLARGKVDILGFIVHFHQGIRSGTQHVGTEVTLTVK